MRFRHWSGPRWSTHKITTLQVEAFLLDWITREPLRWEWFFEEHNGNCRLMAPFAVRLSETAQT